MYLFISSLVSLIVSLVILILLIQKYLVIRARPIFYLLLVALMQFLASIFSILGTIASTKEVAINYFTASLILFSFTILLGLLFVEIMRTGSETTIFTLIGSILIGCLFVDAVYPHPTKEYLVFKVNGFWERSSFRSDIGRILIIIYIALFIIDFIYVTRKYLHRTVTKEKKKYAYYLFLAVLTYILPYIVLSPLVFMYEELRITVVSAQFILTAIGWLILGTVLWRNPYFAYILTQTFLGFLVIRKSDGTLIYEKAFVERLKDKAALFASFLSATFTAVSELMGVGNMREILFTKTALTFEIGNYVYVALITDKPSPIVSSILQRMLVEIEHEIPKDDLLSPAIEEKTIQKIDEILNRHLYVLLP